MTLSGAVRLFCAVNALLTFASSVFPEFARAETPQEKGLRIFQEQEKKDAGWKSFKVKGKMILKDGSGVLSERNLEMLTMERNTPTEGNIARMFFLDPADVRGVVLLSKAKAEPEDDEQWVYMPATHRVRRIASANRSGKFLSSEFSYEDLSGEKTQDNTYEWLKEGPCPGQESMTCDQVAAFPKNAASGYTKRIVHVDKAEKRVFLVEFYNRSEALEKKLSVSGYKNYNGHWRPALMEMTNLLNGRKTELHQSEYAFDVKPTEDDFSPEQLGK